MGDELREALRFFDPAALATLPAAVRESVDRALALAGTEFDPEHAELARGVRRAVESGGAPLGELIVRAAAVRHFLG
jgi:hypothetical protein